MCRQITLSILFAWSMLIGAERAVTAEKTDEKKPGKKAENLLPNPSFEKTAGAKPASWTTQTWGGKGKFSVADVARTGKHSLLISSEEGADCAWTTTVSVDPHSLYQLSGWIKTEDLDPRRGGRAAKGALLNIHNLQPTQTGAVTGTKDWTKVQVAFDTAGETSLQINCLLGGWGLATGKAYYDDIQLVKLSGKDWQPTVAIDAAKTGHPISKYIYGQFIEHLGRCIYGGIWAEMLEDRKFYFPVTSKYDPYKRLQNTRFPVVGASPWEIVGPAGGVKMVKEDSFVGDQTPLVSAKSGIRQNDLAIVKGKEYVGYVWLKADGGKATVKIALSGAEGDGTTVEVGDKYEKFPLKFTAAESTGKASLAIHVEQGKCYVGTASLMPGDNVEGFRADTLALLRELNSPVYRWPGGNFVSGYDWRDGIGPRDRRPPRKNPAWTGVEHNDVGIDEFMAFCRLVDTEPYIAVNSGLGGLKSAVEELQYCNGAADTPMGKLRAKNGHPEPYKVKWWGIGNEMYGGWQLGHMPLEKYQKKHNEFAEAMRKEDPSIKVVAVGATGKWSEGMMQHCADHMDLVSEHFYRHQQKALSSHVKQIPDSVRGKAQAHRDYRKRFDSLKGKDIDIALDEWNYWYGPHEFGELGTRYFLKDALGVAAGLHEYARQSDIMFMANYAQTVNVIGCIKTSKTDASFATTGLALKLYRQHFGTLPVKVTADPPLDVMAALTVDKKKLTIGIVNPTMKKLDLPIEITGVKPTGRGKQWQIAGPDPMAYNEPGKPPKVTIEESPLSDVKDKLPVAACSVTLVELELE